MSELDGTPITSSCKCPKCNGLLVDDIFLCEASYWMGGVRCVNCGLVRLNKEVKGYANQTKDRRVDKELELYKIRSRSKLRTTTLRTSTY
jgi:hypothetical protein